MALFLRFSDMEEVLKKIYAFGDQAHGNQLRKYSTDRYMLHCQRVMQTCRKYTQDLSVLAAALLHDILEDTPLDEEALQQFLQQTLSAPHASKTLRLVVELTDVYVKSAYPTWNRKKRRKAEAARIAKTSPEAQTIKYADIMDNCLDIADQDPDFAKVFLRECHDLLQVMTKGSPALRDKAFETVEKGQEHLTNRQQLL